MYEEHTDADTSAKKCDIRPFKNFSIDQTVTVLECNPFYMTAGDTDATEVIIKKLLKDFNERIQELYHVLYPQRSLKRTMKLGLANY